MIRTIFPSAWERLTGTPLDKDEDRLPDYRTLRGVKNPKLPCAVIHYLDAMELVERGASRARLVLQQKKIRRTSKNIILRIPGTEQPEEILTLTAHYDSVPQGPGAYDNMAGAAIIMELAHYFAENRLPFLRCDFRPCSSIAMSRP